MVRSDSLPLADPAQPDRGGLPEPVGCVTFPSVSGLTELCAGHERRALPNHARLWPGKLVVSWFRWLEEVNHVDVCRGSAGRRRQ
ncbi:MAG: hypothetical protein KatS3mg110_3341 [Pirellulaceae bacterium]|nr:MAG: hypothetical protein KatS3mg110_3341 [Pirellulaceae bacterium]